MMKRLLQRSSRHDLIDDFPSDHHNLRQLGHRYRRFLRSSESDSDSDVNSKETVNSLSALLKCRIKLSIADITYVCIGGRVCTEGIPSNIGH